MVTDTLAVKENGSERKWTV